MYGLGSAGLLLLVARSVALTVNLCCPEGTVNEVSIKSRAGIPNGRPEHKEEQEDEM